MILSLNIFPGNPEVSYYLIHISETAFIIIKILISLSIFFTGLFLAICGRGNKSMKFSKFKPLIIFLISQSIIEISHCFDRGSIGLSVIIVVASLVNIIPLAIWAKTAIELTYKSRVFFKIFLLNSIFSFISIVGLGIFMLTIITNKTNEILDQEVAFVQNQLDKVDINDYNELSMLISSIDEKLDYYLHLTDEPELITQKGSFINSRTISVNNDRGSSIVFGLSYERAHFYLGIILRLWIRVIIIFNFIFSTSYYIYKRKQ